MFWNRKAAPVLEPVVVRPELRFPPAPQIDVNEILADIHRSLPRGARMNGVAFDDSSDGYPDFKSYAVGQNTISDTVINWFSTQGFIGHQLCGILAQHWLINKACGMPGDDAIRKGYQIVSADGEDLDEKTVKLIRRYDRAFNLNRHLREFVRKGRIFGVRIAMFRVESTDPQYYEKPFNIDGVTANSYKGIVQLDPYWVAPWLDESAASKPDSMHFYEPTWWVINGKKVHRSHVVIFRHCEPVDILKPSYIYGGVPLPQQIMERVYAAERTANEGPQLAMSKRTGVWYTNITRVIANMGGFMSAIANWTYARDNFGVKIGDKEEDDYQQFDTSLADLDAVIMSQYQLVAAQACVPATKLLGTTPKGFNATGEYEEASYHELLEGIQAHDLTPFVERHHALVIQSYVPGVDTQVTVLWNPPDAPTAKEVADTNLVKAQAGAALIASGAISSEDERTRVAMDKDSGYNHIDLSVMPEPSLDDPESEDED